MGFFIALLLFLGFMALISMYYYNKLIALGVRVKEGWSDILVMLKRRHDLIGNLVESVKGYASHEQETLQKVIEARNEAASSMSEADPQMIQSLESKLTKALAGINFSALAEAYPDLKANQNFLSLQAELSDTENKIAASRRFYNITVSDLNTGVQQFPGNLFAGLAHVTVAQFFEMEPGELSDASKAPQVKF